MIHRKGLLAATLATLLLAVSSASAQDRSPVPPVTDGSPRPSQDPASTRPPPPHAAKDRDRDRVGDRDRDRDRGKGGDRKAGMAADGTRPPPHRRPPRHDGDAQAQRRDDGNSQRPAQPPTTGGNPTN